MSSIFGSPAAQQRGMEWLRELDAGLGVAHKLLAAQGSTPFARTLRALLKDVWWRNMQLNLEVIQAARDCDFDPSNTELREIAFSSCSGTCNSKHSCEDVFAHMHHLAARSQQGALRMSKLLAVAGVHVCMFFVCCIYC